MAQARQSPAGLAAARPATKQSHTPPRVCDQVDLSSKCILGPREGRESGQPLVTSLLFCSLPADIPDFGHELREVALHPSLHRDQVRDRDGEPDQERPREGRESGQPLQGLHLDSKAGVGN